MSQLGDKKKWRASTKGHLQACAPEPRQRYLHADDMAEDLRRVIEGRRTSRSKGLLRRKTFRLAMAALVLLAIQARRIVPLTNSRPRAAAAATHQDALRHWLAQFNLPRRDAARSTGK